MSKISQIFNLNKTQYELDFIDIDPTQDTSKFIDPYWISKQECDFTIECDLLIKNFFTTLVSLIKNKELSLAIHLCEHLSESSDICLGYSKSRGVSGSGIGHGIATKFCLQLENSEAFQNDILTSIEDVKVFLDDIDVDRISDMVANIIRKPLLLYTQIQCENYNIPLVKDNSNYYWDKITSSWKRDSDVKQLIIDNKKILLTPKKLVGSNKYTCSNFLQHYILNALQEWHIKNNTTLVRKRKCGSLYVTKRSILDKFEEDGVRLDKKFCTQFAVDNPDIFNAFKSTIIGKYDSNEPNYLETVSISNRAKYLIETLKTIQPGKADEVKYQNIIFDILIFILGDRVACPSQEVKIHDGRKRIDVAFMVSSTHGIFNELINVHKIPLHVLYGECKNYSNDIGNPEIDQLSGRFSPMRARFGFLLFRTIENRDLLIKRCRDTYKDDRGLIIPLMDKDIIEILEAIQNNNYSNAFDDKIRTIIFEIIND